jgi:acyl carrier protein
MDEAIKNEVKTIISDIGEIPHEELTEDATFTDDLGVDSMMALEMVAAIEKKYKISIEEEKIPTIRSLGDIYKILQEKL